MKKIALIASLFFAPLAASAEGMDSTNHMQHGSVQNQSGLNVEAGQSAFAAIAEIVTLLETDPATDWSKVNIQALRDHLLDMDRVTLDTRVAVDLISGGAIFIVTGDAETAKAAQRMMLAHAPFLAKATGFRVEAHPLATGAGWRVVSDKASDQNRIRALGFYGLLAVGAHHQPHHLALARGALVH